MQFTAQVDVDVVALEAEDEVTCLVSLTAPVPEEIADRPGETLIAVVDRSGSMDGGPIEAVRTALHQLVDRLKRQDRFGVVVLDLEALVHVSARSMVDHDTATVHALIEGVGVPIASTQLKIKWATKDSPAVHGGRDDEAADMILSAL